MEISQVKWFRCVGLVLLVLGCVLASQGEIVPAPVGPARPPLAAGNSLPVATVADLQAAYADEINGKARYEAFAIQADKEGCKSVARLFRAAARSETIHASRCVTALRGLSVEPTAKAVPPVVKSTRENLAVALGAERGEEKEKAAAAVTTPAAGGRDAPGVKPFQISLAAEIEHARMLRQALDNFEDWKQDNKKFWVCARCGYTMMNQPPPHCPVCQNFRSNFEAIP